VSAALAGLRVLDFSTLLPGPLATLMLAEAGAEVIKIERPDGGDAMRRDPHYFALLNRGKRSLALDLKSEAARAALRPLVESADVLIEQFRPGVMQRLGLGYETLAAINPRLIYVSIAGYRSDGPEASRPGHDLTYAAESGLLSLAAGGDGAPVLPAALVADIAGGSYPAVLNVLLALRRRDASGRGCRVEIAMRDGLLPFLYEAIADRQALGIEPKAGYSPATGGSPRYQLYRTLDGRHLAVAAVEEKFWRNFCEAIGLPASFRDDARDPAATQQAVAERIASRSGAEWEARLDGLDVCCSLVRNVGEAMSRPELARLFDRSVRFDARTLGALPLPLSRSLLCDDACASAPALGEANDALLKPA